MLKTRSYNLLTFALTISGRSVTKKQVGIIIASVLLMAMFIVASLFCIWRKKLKKQGKGIRGLLLYNLKCKLCQYHSFGLVENRIYCF